MSWADITPTDVAQNITFNREDIDWIYDEMNTTCMYSKQAEGVAGLCHRLNQYSIAILADEVGMGKTMQAFGVLTMLWKDNPKARVLVFAPRREVAQNWSNEYNEYKNKHVKANGVIHPSSAVLVHRLDHKDGNATKETLPDLEDTRVLQAKLVIAKVTSLSYMHTSAQEPTINDFKEKAKSLKHIMQGFDVIIVDEAHYLRNVNGDSIRANVAKELFRDLKPDVKILLMTATPNHNHKNDVVNIVSYFTKSISHNVPIDSKGILTTLAIRRLRRLHGKNKYQYRQENALKAHFTSSKKAIDNNELFFAFYQKKIVQEGIGSNNSKGRAFWNYLEGTEFDPSRLKALLKSSQAEDDKTENISTDYIQADDRQILLDLLNNYQKAFNNQLPSNPKYEKMVDELVCSIGQDQQSNHKALIFVRRIPSAEEITRQVIEQYDLYFWLMIQKSIQGRQRIGKNFQNSWDRKWFERWIQKQPNIPAIKLEDNIDEQDWIDDELENSSEITSNKKSTYRSVVLSWFKSPKKDTNGAKDVSTHAYRFVRRFEQDGAYSTFFNYDSNNKTLWAYIKNTNWDRMSDDQKVSFSLLIKKAVLHASVGVIELYSCFLRSNGKYDDFFRIVIKNLDKMIFYHQIIEMLNHFEIFYSKIMGINEDKLVEQKWDLFNNSQPAYGYVGGTRNKTVLNTFNTPFFPDIITATSVLQEGVNLQYYCKKIYHYGVAWSPGDDEQRIGRVDRMFGMVERQLKQPVSDHPTTLDIYYPYLEATHDANVLTNFLDKKRKAEVELDNANILINDNTIQDKMDPNMIEDLLLKPEKDGIHYDPYPYKRIN